MRSLRQQATAALFGGVAAGGGMAAGSLREGRAGLRATPALRGLEQVQDVPASTDRAPRGFHRGPGKRQTSPREAAAYQFIRKWDLTMREEWDALEAFKGLPKPKAQFGNEAAEVVWPYALLLERVVRVHPFTKSIYVYYSQRQATAAGARAAAAARAFAREFLVPITFHNSQVYTEAEMLLEFSETPWVVVHCLDGTTRTLPVAAPPPADAGAPEPTPRQAAEALLARVVAACAEMGAAAADPRGLTRALNERPLQNQYLRVDYQWFGDTPEERTRHLVHWDYDPAAAEPKLRDRTRHVMDWLNYDAGLPSHSAVRANVHREAARMRRPTTTRGPRTFFNSAGARANARHSRFGGAPKTA